MDILGQSSLLVAVISLALGISVFAKNVRNKLYLLFSLLCLLICVWSLFFFMEIYRGGKDFYQLHLHMNIWLAPMSLWFIREFAQRRDKKTYFILYGSFVLSIILSSLLFLGEKSALVMNAVYFAPAILFIQIIIFIFESRSRNQIAKPTLIYGGAILVLLTSVMDHVPSMGRVVPSIGNVILAIYLFFLSQSVLQHRLLNFAALFYRFLIILGVALTLTGIYSLLFAWIQDKPLLFFLNSFFVSILILMLLDPLRAIVGFFAKKMLSQSQKQFEIKLENAKKELNGIVSAEALYDVIIEMVERTLSPESALLFVLDQSGNKYKKVRSIRSQVFVDEILSNHILIEHWLTRGLKNKNEILFDQLLESEIERSASRGQTEKLKNILVNMRSFGNLLIPIMDESQVYGFVGVEVSSPPIEWGESWGFLNLFYPYFVSVAQTMQNLDIYIQSKEKERLAALGEMAAGLAHEIRNPLGAIKGAAQFLDPNVNRPESQFLKIIIEEVDRLNRVVTLFLDYSKSEHIPFETVDLNEVVKKVTLLIKSNLRSGVEVCLQLSHSPIVFEGSSTQLHQLLINLIQNSINAFENLKPAQLEKKALITVTTDIEQYSSGERYVKLIVTDNGPGIKKENFEKIFIPFFTTVPSGTGLGLSICQKIVRSHHGKIQVESELGQGAKFIVTLKA